MRKKFIFIGLLFVCCIGFLLYNLCSNIQKDFLNKEKKEAWSWIGNRSWFTISPVQIDSDFCPSRDNSDEYPYLRFSYPFLSVVDGDTIKILYEGEETSVRLIWVDTPEKYSTRYGYAECFGEEASTYLNNLLVGVNEVQIEFDDTQGTYDKYWRLLWYLFVNGENYNQKIIEDGYAREYTYKTPYHYQSIFKEAQKNAESWNRWLWNIQTCNGERKSL